MDCLTRKYGRTYSRGSCKPETERQLCLVWTPRANPVWSALVICVHTKHKKLGKTQTWRVLIAVFSLCKHFYDDPHYGARFTYLPIRIFLLGPLPRKSSGAALFRIALVGLLSDVLWKHNEISDGWQSWNSVKRTRKFSYCFFLKYMDASYYHTPQREDKNATRGDKLQGVGTQQAFSPR